MPIPEKTSEAKPNEPRIPILTRTSIPSAQRPFPKQWIRGKIVWFNNLKLECNKCNEKLLMPQFVSVGVLCVCVYLCLHTLSVLNLCIKIDRYRSAMMYQPWDRQKGCFVPCQKIASIQDDLRQLHQQKWDIWCSRELCCQWIPLLKALTTP